VCCCVLQCIVVYCCVLLCVAVYCCVLQCIAVYSCVFLCIAVYCCVFLCIAVYCSVSQGIPVYRTVLQASCNVLQGVAWRLAESCNLLNSRSYKPASLSRRVSLSVSQVSVSLSHTVSQCLTHFSPVLVLQCAAVCCSVLQGVAYVAVYWMCLQGRVPHKAAYCVVYPFLLQGVAVYRLHCSVFQYVAE